MHYIKWDVNQLVHKSVQTQTFLHKQMCESQDSVNR